MLGESFLLKREFILLVSSCDLDNVRFPSVFRILKVDFLDLLILVEVMKNLVVSPSLNHLALLLCLRTIASLHISYFLLKDTFVFSLIEMGSNSRASIDLLRSALAPHQPV